MFCATFLQRVPPQIRKKFIMATELRASCYNSGSFVMNIVKLFLTCAGLLSHTESLYSSRGRINAMYIFWSAFRLLLNLSDLIRFNLGQAVSAILFMCAIQEHVLDMVSPTCLWLVVSLRTTLFISREG